MGDPSGRILLVALDPMAGKLLDEVAASGRPNAHLLPVPEARANVESLFAGLGPGQTVAAVADHVVPVAGATIPARSYRPAGVSAGDVRPLVVSYYLPQVNEDARPGPSGFFDSASEVVLR
jgi:hypothetical protein